MSVSLNLRENQGSIKKNLTSSLLFYHFLPVLNVYYTLFPLFIYYILYYFPLINWRRKKACLTAYFTVNPRVPSCVSHNFVFGSQLSSSSTASCIGLYHACAYGLSCYCFSKGSLPSAFVIQFPPLLLLLFLFLI